MNVFYRTRSFLVLAIFAISSFEVFVKSPHLTFGDDGIYIRAGERILNGDSVYEGEFRGGPIGGVFMYGFSKLFPDSWSWAFLQFTYLICVVILVFILQNHNSTSVKLATSFFVITSAPVREMINNHQITSLVVLSSFWPFFVKKKSLWIFCLSALSIAIGFDLKPQIALPILTGLGIFSRKLLLVFSGFVTWISLHTFLAFYSGENLLSKWFDILRRLRSTGKWGESIHPWPLLERLGISSPFLLILQYLVVFLILSFVIYFSVVRNFDLLLLSLGSLAFFLEYAHFYDLLILTTIIYIAAISRPTILTSWFVLVTLIPTFILSIPNFVFWLTNVLFFFLIIGRKNLNTKVVVLSILTMAVNYYVQKYNLISDDEGVRYRSLCYVVFAGLALYSSNKIKYDTE